MAVLDVAGSAPVDFVASFVAELRARAQDRRSEGADAQAQLYTRVADELETGYRAHLLEVVPIDVAAQESGYSSAQLYRIRSRLGHALRRCDLPRRPLEPEPPSPSTTSSKGAAGALVDRAFKARLTRSPR